MQSPLWKAKAVVDELQDLVWTVNTSPPTRWRLYVTYDVLDTPTAFLSKAEKQHHTFLAQRQRSARSAVQLTKFAQLAEGVCEPDVVDTLLFHATYALLELRSAELKVIGYQLLLGTLGFRTQQRDLLFLATHHAYELLSLLWTVANQFGPLQASPRDRRALRDSRPLRVLSEETKAKLKAARQAKADAKRLAAEQAEAARQAALHEETQRAAAAQAKKAAAAERRRQNRLLKQGLDAALGPSDEAAAAAASSSPAPKKRKTTATVPSTENSPPSKGKGKGKAPACPAHEPLTPTPTPRKRKALRELDPDTVEPPKWFHKFVGEIMAEDLDQKGQKPTKKLQQEVQQKAKATWSDGVRREQMQHAMDSHRQDMYSMIFGGMTR